VTVTRALGGLKGGGFSGFTMALGPA
jgi:hypothetical protein